MSFQALAESTRPFGANAYLEVARRRFADESGATEFLVITRGFFAADGSKRWTKFVTLPDDAALRTWLVETLTRI